MTKLRKGESTYENGFRFRKMVNGKRVSCYAPTIKELREKEKELEAQRNIFVPEQAIRNETLGKKIEGYLLLKQEVKTNTRLSYEMWYSAIRNEWIMSVPIRRLKTSDIQRWIVEQHQKGKSYSTINGYFTGLIRPALDVAVMDGDIRCNPANFKLTTVLQKTAKTKRPLTDEEQDILLNHFLDRTEGDKELSDVVHILLQTGIRISELCGITDDDLDFEKNEIHISKQFIRVKGVGQVLPLKSTSGNRYVPMNEDVRSIFLELISKDRPEVEYGGYSGFLFYNRSKLPTDKTQLRSRYYLALKRLDDIYGTNLHGTTFHTLRHTYCTNLIRKGVNVRVVQYLMGHATAGTTLEVYSHVNRDFVKDELDRADIL